MKGWLGHDSDSPDRDPGAVARIERARCELVAWTRSRGRTGIEFRYCPAPFNRSAQLLASANNHQPRAGHATRCRYLGSHDDPFNEVRLCSRNCTRGVNQVHRSAGKHQA